ncbi:hypothetical protein C7999DRAFT_35493 [Corynascus novoguineensis]|uniref:Peptidase S8/S53 domain-containing protein n=1 Tax=Corynascus novoguineensis TaxID=1126955 RepID=A0AAN7CL60_9PEZI|nr:hypothetical protein C7999DRAFT_35493 [Corynascus novoguineensis]
MNGEISHAAKESEVPKGLRRYEDDWKKSQRARDFAPALDSKVFELFHVLTQSLKSALDAESPPRVDRAVSDITEFLRDAKERNKIDSCIRWLILLRAAGYAPNDREPDQDGDDADSSSNVHGQSRQGNERKAIVTIVGITADMEGYLCFETPQAAMPSPIRNGNTLFKGSCKDPATHWKYSKKKSTPFHEAVSNGNHEIVRRVIQSLERYCEQQVIVTKDNRRPLFQSANSKEELLVHVLRQQDPSTKRTALQEAAGDQQVNLEILKELLRYPGIADPPDSTFKDALEDGIEIVVQTFLENDTFSDRLVTSENLIRAMELQHEVFRKFVAEFPDSVSQKALVPQTEKPKDDGKGYGYYPLWYNNKMWEKSRWVDRNNSSPEIRTELVTATIRGIHKMQRLSETLEQSAVYELCFDISQFDSKLYRVRHFALSLISHRENEGLLSYEPIIEYARFPPLDLHPDDKDNFGMPPREEHTEVFDILKWLRRTKKVSSIIELKVPDMLVNPHNELTIARYVKKFGVEILDWRFLDLSLSVFPKEVKSKIRGIHLYSSGKRAAISHWLGNDDGEGLRSLRNLSWVRIHVIRDLMSAKDCKRACRDISDGLDKLKEDWAKGHGVASRELMATVNSQPWNPTQETSVDFEEIAQRVFPKLARFISSYRAYANSVLQNNGKGSESFRPIRVAILDNGILSMLPVSNDTPVRVRARPPKRGRKSRGQTTHSEKVRRIDANTRAKPKKFGFRGRTKPDEAFHDTGASTTDEDEDEDDGDDDEDEDGHTDSNDARFSKGPRTLWSRVKEGRSFVDDDNQVSPWLFASDPHGTQMANLICDIDPLCELYVAKVTDGYHYGITPHRVARVDIISMSFTMFEELNTLHASIKSANSDDIIMMCSSHDQGANISDSWPAGYSETITIAACDKYGKLPRNLDESKANYAYKIHGLDVPAGAVPFLASANSVSGSSAATAIASGLSSLILSCVRLTNPPPGATTGDRGKSRQTLVREYFKDMVSPVAEKYLPLEKFGNLDAKVKEGEVINAEQILRSSFAGAYERDRRVAH